MGVGKKTTQHEGLIANGVRTTTAELNAPILSENLAVAQTRLGGDVVKRATDHHQHSAVEDYAGRDHVAVGVVVVGGPAPVSYPRPWMIGPAWLQSVFTKEKETARFRRVGGDECEFTVEC